ncbi:MAG: hypothetical protein JEZ14_11385 [Marinilabiliaceae bacterium]|nr:hypothetical protein [Marinilabiliaceae bacterium]
MEDYLSSLIESLYGKRYFLKAAKQTTGIATINTTQLKRFPVIMAPISIQKQYKLAVNNIQAQKDCSNKAYKRAKTCLMPWCKKPSKVSYKIHPMNNEIMKVSSDE